MVETAGTLKICNGCGSKFEQPLGKYQARCRTCRNAEARDYYSRKKDGDVKAWWFPQPREHSQNKVGARAWRYKAVYNITIEDYDRMAAQQDGRCLICQRKDKLVIDHDHETGSVRGLLCSACNTGIGLLQDNTEILLAAASYLSRKTVL